MAIVFEQKKNSFGFFRLLIVLFLLTVIGGTVYYLFFAPVPGIEVVAPLTLQQAEELSQIQFDPASVVGSPQFKRLKVYTGLPGTGVLGRPDPFVPF